MFVCVFGRVCQLHAETVSRSVQDTLFSLCLLLPVEAQVGLISSEAQAAQQPPEETES